MDDETRAHDLIEALLGDGAPAVPDGLTEDEVALLQTAAMLKAGCPGALTPTPQFVAELRQRLFSTAAHVQGQDARHPQRREPAPSPPASSPQAAGLSRRRLLRALAGGAAAGVGLGAAGGRVAAEGEAAARVQALTQHAAAQLARVERERTRPYGVPLVGTHGQWMTVADQEQVPPGGAVRFEAGALVGYLLRDRRGLPGCLGRMHPHGLSPHLAAGRTAAALSLPRLGLC